jgi:hypothetical protein
MDDQQTDDQQNHSVELLLAEYQYLGDCFWRNEEVGERRVDFFITVTAALIAASLAAIEQDFVALGDDVVPALSLGLAALLLFGFVTLVRMIHRNVTTDDYKRKQNRIRRYFADKDPDILKHLAYDPYEVTPRTKKWHKVISLGHGGLVETVQLLNSFIAFTLGALLALRFPRWNAWLVGLVCSVAAWSLQFAYVKKRYDKKAEEDELKFRGD